MANRERYHVVLPDDFDRARFCLDRDISKAMLRELEWVLETQKMEDGDEKRERLEEIDEELIEFFPYPRYIEYLIQAVSAQIFRAECRLKLQDAYEAYQAALKAENDIIDSAN